MGKVAALLNSDRDVSPAEMREVLNVLAEESGVAPLPPPSATYKHLSRSSVSYRIRVAPNVEEPTIDLNLADIVDTDFVGIHQDETEDAHRTLTASIAEYGLVQPVTVVQQGATPGKYVLIDGRRRLRAVAASGRKKIRATIRSVANETEARIVHLISNCVCDTVSPFELASFCEGLIRDGDRPL